MKSIIEILDLKGKRVLVRVDWNVPIENGEVVDNFRIKKSMSTLEYLRDKEARVTIATHVTHGSIESLQKFVPAGMTLLPNLRDHPGEEANSPEFAKELAGQADIYVNEAFSESHREYTSIVGIPKLLPSFIGLQFEKEIEALSQAFNPPRPFLLIIGGAKPETKLPLIEKLLSIADTIFVGGTLAKDIINKNPKIILPLGDLLALDADENVIRQLEEQIKNSSFILWNGPLGNYEKGFKKGTLTLAKILSTCSKQVIIGGGDTLATIRELDIYDKFSFVSTAGGAMLQFLATGTLPGIEALK
ncbi:MAG: phosphoglycerate kinase [Candidatus Zambryskibacteria bacterium]|nr:phosphoglycerate kinase [Candidatus Zambryskibacteria bacterium]